MNATASAALLSVRGLTKTFGALRALDAVDLDFVAGEVHAILGENGAGKSTLMHVLDGVYRPDSGVIRLDGKQVEFASPRAAAQAGIGMVHQHFALVDALTVAENLALSLAGSSWRFDQAVVASAARQLAENVGLELPSPETFIRDLPVGARQRLEILKALAGAGRVLILDEPTAVLTPSEARQLFAMLRQLRQQGRLILFITHKLREVKDTADRVTVMRHGRVIGTYDVAAVSEELLAERMVGRLQAPVPRPPASPKQEPVALEALRLTYRSAHGVLAVDDVSFAVRRGEILGIAGVDGNGQNELFGLLAGLLCGEGSLALAGRALPLQDTAALRAAGVGFIPPDRHHDGLVLPMSVGENLLLHRGILAQFQRHGVLQRAAAWRYAGDLAQRYKIKFAGLEAPASSLSGGNQQRVIIARELSQQPSVLITVNPTRGLDLAASRAVADALREAASAGCAIVLISTDLDEVLDLGDSVRVLFRGRLSAALNPPVDIDRLGRLMAGVADVAGSQTP